jgi:hypothetical protein
MKQILVKIPEADQEQFQAVIDQFPRANAQDIIRALVLTTPKIGIVNALAKHASRKWKEPEDET